MLHQLKCHTIGALLLPKLRSYFAEFLNKGSLARLRFLTLSTCVGLRYGHLYPSLEAFLDSLGSASSLLNFAPYHISEFSQGGFAYLASYLLRRTLPTVRCAYPSVSLHPQTVYRWYWNLNQLSIAYALRLGLGPDLPWADEPSPGILRFSAGRILTCLIVYSYRHSHFCTLHCSLRYSFDAYRTLPYRLQFNCNP